jgi:hypothetical protein
MTKNNTKKRKYNDKTNISLEELNKCDHFCNNYYFEKRKQTIKQYYKKQNISDKEINKKMINIDRDKIIQDCKQNYCNPSCTRFRKRLPKRYVCPACKKQFIKAKKMGAITHCMGDGIVHI